MAERDDLRIDLLRQLKGLGYGFVTPGNDSHRRVVRRRGLAGDLRDVFGWNLPFRPGTVRPELFEAMGAAGLLVRRRRYWRSALRVASLDRTLFWHSAWPPKARDAVFFGPDSYRFADFVCAELPPGPLRIADIGTGSGVGAIAAALARPGSTVLASDLNPAALELARVNAAAAGVELTLAQGSGLAPLDGQFDVIIANPPFFAGKGGRLYRDGGGDLGMEVALVWAQEAADRLAPGGRLLLYSGAPVVAGVDRLREGLERVLVPKGLVLRYREIDPDIFGGLLNHPRYWRVERIAAVGLVAERQQ
ncbi:SAM-dependent methyltransferase [Caulobacter ginsengisoli]|uniref:SAM-dependent methyltransferase n=1 Tax=Caulobacter ginsengisoli TaxID=400775 RepID=A0ABU0IU65_9CAUL|nr:class I SAM-dependent methyltransferase [Caulobacter ginsengisoli]MDQ0465550.1 SAM-dependent methyltransferase [Caulobacter ginsengisoli]